MGAVRKILEKKALRDLIPLNALSAVHLEEISRKAVVEEVRAGCYVFRKGDRDYQSVYLIEGKIELLDKGREIVGTVNAGSEAARHPLAHKQPRQLSARAAGPVTVARVDSSLLDVLLTWDESSGYDVVEIDAEENDDWMSRVLRSQAFLQLPPSNIHQLLMRLEEVQLGAGDTVVRQGEEGDYFYIVKSGRLAVSKKPSQSGKEVVLAELGEGACFGEEALVAGTSRNASVTMITDGTLMRLSKDDFNELLCASLVHEVGFAEAERLVAQGARWLDVRLPGEFENQTIRDSINLPLSALRDQSAELEGNVPYVVCCDTGRRSAAGAFVLGQRGFTVYVLKNGLMDVPDTALTGAQGGADRPGESQDAEIIPFGAEPGAESEGSAPKRGEAAAQSTARAQRQHSDHAGDVDGASSRELAQYKKQLREMQSRLQQAEAQRAEEQAVSARVIQQIDTLEKDLQRAMEERAELERQLPENQADKQSTDGELAERQAAERREHEKRSRTLEQELGQVREDYKQLGQRASTLAGERDAAVSDLERVNSELAAVQEKLVGAQGESSGQIDMLQRRLDERSTALQQEQDQQGVLRQQLADLETSRKQSEQALAEASAREQELQRRLQEAQQQAETALEAARSDASGSQASLNRRIAELQAELETQRQQLDSQQSQRDELEQTLKEVSDAEQQAREQIRAAEADAVAGRHDLERARDESEDLRRALDELRLQHGEAEKRVAELEARLADDTKEHASDIASVRDALARAQDERENVKRDQKRLMESQRKAERKLEQERQNHEAEVHRLRKELKQTAGESSAGLAAELEALQQRLKEGADDREELEIKLGERSAQLETVQAQLQKLTKQLAQAQDSARQAEQHLVESAQAANEEMTIRLTAEQEIQEALREDLKKAVLDREEQRREFEVLGQEMAQLREALESERAQLDGKERVERQVAELKEQLQQAERERDAARAAEQQLQQQTDQLRAEAEVNRGLVDMAPQGADQGLLRTQLEEARASAAEGKRQHGAAQEQLVLLQKERDRLQVELSESRFGATADVPAAQIPSLDADDPDAASILQSNFGVSQPAADPAPSAAVLLDADVRVEGLVDHDAGRAAGGGKRLLVAVVVVALLAVATLWWLQRLPAPQSVAAPESDLGREPSRAAGQGQQDSAATPEDAVEKVVPKNRVPALARGMPDIPRRAAAKASAAGDEVQQAPESQVSSSGRDGRGAGTSAKRQSPGAARNQPGKKFRDRLNDGGRGPSMVEIHADRFKMGSGSASPNFDERPRHEVSLRRFAISQYEITFEQYDRFAQQTGRARPRSAGGARGTRPVVNVSWQDAVAYTEWLSGQTGHRYRLPTEAEWEFTARAGTITRYWWGNKVGDGRANCFDCGGDWAGRETAAVGSFAPSGFGLYDTAGNAREWVRDCYVRGYDGAPADGSAVVSPACAKRVIRGGGYASPSAKLRVAARDSAAEGARLDDLGFRVVREY